MKQAVYHSKALFEHRFWLQVLGDHSRFILSNLSPEETEEVNKAQKFIQVFDELLEQARREVSDAQLREITQEAFEFAQRIRMFKLHLIRRHIIGKIDLHLPPTFLNHMVNEVEEYVRVLECLCSSQIPPLIHPLHHEHLWLVDAVGHAATIAGSVDEVERTIQEKGLKFAEDFRQLNEKAYEFKGYLRTGITDWPALSRLNCQVEQKILSFSEFLYSLREMLMTNEALAGFGVLTPDHMLREECYFLTKLAEVSEIEMPKCDPTSPRIE